MSCRSLLVLALLLVLPAPAAAFNSSCYTEDGEHCSHFDGYEAPRSRWYHDDLTPGSTDAEHAQIWIRAAEVSGLPPELLDEFRLRHFSSDEVLPWSEAVTNPTGLMSVMTFSGIADREYQSWAPVSFAPDSIRDRTHTIAEFSQLPDFSWALWDWAQGNETCPAVDGLEPDICHLFAEHLGSLNSSHFLPQGADWYAHYHDLALDRAAECSEMWAQIPESERDRLESYALLCEKEALVLEAIGHHFLQDAWSMGHMWERWGGSALEVYDWEYPYLPDVSSEDDLAVAKLIGAFAGMIHGAKSVTDAIGYPIADFVDEMLILLDESGIEAVIDVMNLLGMGPYWLEDVPALLEMLNNTQPLLADDPMCFPYEDDVGFSDPWLDERLFAGGDYTWTSFILEGGGPSMDDQLEALLGCSVDGMRQVYLATGMAHGSPEDPDLEAIDPSRTVDSDEACFGQRADNEALMTGYGIHLGAWPNQEPLGPLSVDEALDVVMTSLLVASIVTEIDQPSELQTVHFGIDAVTIAASFALYGQDEELKHETNLSELRIAGPDGTLDTPDDSYLTLLGIEPNSFYPGVGTYADPELPWAFPSDGSETGDRQEALHLAFADAHAAERCEQLTLDDFDAWQTAVSIADAETRSARCAQCVQMVTPHLRLGTEGDYNTELEPLCHYVSDGPYVYAGDIPAAMSVSTAARSWCGCAARLAVLVDGAAPGLQLWELEDEALEQVELPLGVDDILLTDGRPRDLAVGGPGGERAFVTAQSGYLHVFELIDGLEVELDLDPGPGFGRYTVGDNPRGVAVMHAQHYALIATADDVVVFDTDALEEVARVPASSLGLSGPDRPWDIAISSDDERAFVSVFGTPGDPSNTVLMLDLEAILDGTTDSSVVESLAVGSSTNPYGVELSRGGEMLAVALFSQDRVAILDTADGSIIDVSSEPAILFFAQDPLFGFSQYPKGLGWARDDTAAYAGFISGNNVAQVSGDPPPRLSGHGVVRRCPFASEKCLHEVGVQGSLEDLVVAAQGDSDVVIAADSLGNLTVLTGDLFEASPETVGVDGWGNFDGTGGCLDEDGRALPCTSTANVGQSIARLVLIGDGPYGDSESRDTEDEDTRADEARVDDDGATADDDGATAGEGDDTGSDGEPEGDEAGGCEDGADSDLDCSNSACDGAAPCEPTGCACSSAAPPDAGKPWLLAALALLGRRGRKRSGPPCSGA